jgi:branched-chain amino acid transport system substrate-binding protein
MALCVCLAPGCKDREDASGGAGSGLTGDTIKVGEYGSMTGSEAAFGKSTHDGIMLAAEEINNTGGINGKKIEIVGPEDTESNNQKGEIAVKRLVEKGVVAVLGEVASSISLAGAPVCQKNQIPMISPSSTNPKVTEVGDYVFRVCFIDPFQGAVIARFAKDTLKANTAAIFYDAGQAYSVGIRDEFTKAFTARGGRIVVETSYTKGDKDFKAPLTKIKDANPDVILVPGYYTEAGTICKQARDLGIAVPVLGGDGWDNAKYHEYAGNNITNCYFSNHMSIQDTSPKIQEFIARYKARYSGAMPDALGALGYDAMMVLADAMKRARSLKGPDLRDAIAQTSDFDGVTGKITINAQRNADKGAVIMEVKNGTFQFKEAIPHL